MNHEIQVLCAVLICIGLGVIIGASVGYSIILAGMNNCVELNNIITLTDCMTVQGWK